MVYKTSGVCSSAISFDIDDAGKVHDVKFQGGCSGNTQGVAKLIEGMDAKEAISRLEGIRCGFRPTSCPDQLSKASISKCSAPSAIDSAGHSAAHVPQLTQSSEITYAIMISSFISFVPFTGIHKAILIYIRQEYKY